MPLKNENIYISQKENIDVVRYSTEIYANEMVDVTLVVPDKDYLFFEYNISDKIKIKKDSDYDKLLKCKNIIKEIITIKKDKLNWYYQQYLKMLIVSLSHENVWIIDGDTYINPSLINYCSENSKILVSKENVLQYNMSINIIRKTLKYTNEKSFITNGSYVDPKLFNLSLDESLDNFFVNWLKIVDSNTSLEMSEYQYFGIIMKESGYSIHHPKIFRRADLLGQNKTVVIKKLKNKYDIIAFEDHHAANFIKKFSARVLATIGYSW